MDRPERSYDHPDAIILRDANNFVHRVTGYIMHVLDGSEMVGQDGSVTAMIDDYYERLGLAPALAEWLAV